MQLFLKKVLSYYEYDYCLDWILKYALLKSRVNYKQKNMYIIFRFEVD